MIFLDPPIGGEQGRELAKQELKKPIYHRDDPSPLDRALSKVQEWLNSLFQTIDNPSRSGGGGIIALLIILVLLIVIIVLVVLYMRRRNARSQRDALLDGETMAAADHRSLAEQLAGEGRYAEAIRERLRAIARDLEERAILDPRPGRTADELATEAGAELPELADELATGVRIFDDVWYGDRPGTAEGYATLTTLEERVRTTRPRPLSTSSAVAGGFRRPE